MHHWHKFHQRKFFIILGPKVCPIPRQYLLEYTDFVRFDFSDLLSLGALEMHQRHSQFLRVSVTEVVLDYESRGSLG